MIIEKCLWKRLFATDWFVLQFCWNDPARNPFPATTTQLFLQSASTHTLCSCLQILSTTNKRCNFWHSNIQQVSTYAFCSWDDVFTQKWNCSFLDNFCKCTESPSTLSTNNSVERNLYLSWSDHLATTFRLEKNAGGFSEHQNKTKDTDRFKWYFFTACVSQVKVNTLERIFEQRSELKVANCLIVHVLWSSYIVSSLELRNKRKATQQRSFRVANDLYSIRSVYIMRECMRTML